MGPRARAGKKVSAANIYTINIRTTIKVTVSVRRVPAIASCAMIARYRPKNIARPVVMFQNRLLSASPSKPEPLLAAEDEYS